MTTTANINPAKTTDKKLLVNFCVVALCLLLISCNKNEPVLESHDDHGLILIGNTKVTLTPQHIASIKSEQYQPSLNLYGQLSPVQQTSVTFKSAIKIKSCLVQNKQTVKKGEVLFTYTLLPNLSKSSNIIELNSHTDSRDNAEPKNLTKQVTPDLNEPVNITDDTSSNLQNSLQPNKANNIEKNIEINTNANEQVLEYKAPFNGIISTIYYNASNTVTKNAPVLNIQSVDMFKFIGLLPAYTKPRLTIGKHVNLALDDAPEVTGLTGQVAKVVELDNQHKVAVHVHMLEDSNQHLPKVGAMVTGKLDYGQLEVGTLVDVSAIHGADLSAFYSADAHVAAPIKAFVWIVNQDKLLAKQAVEVIRYNSQSKQYLVSGIPSDSLIVLANLPTSAEGKILHIS